jgi:hypothetical protein
MPAFFLRKRLLRHLDSETGIRHHFQLYFSFLLLSNHRHHFFCPRPRMKRNQFRMSRTNNSARVKTLLFLRRESFLHLLFTFFSVDLHVSQLFSPILKLVSCCTLAKNLIFLRPCCCCISHLSGDE